jgi:hypothetical protein
MKTINKDRDPMNPRRVALLLGLSLGLGVCVHEGFFVVAGAIAVSALAVASMHAVEKHRERTHLIHQHH